MMYGALYIYRLAYNLRSVGDRTRSDRVGIAAPKRCRHQYRVTGPTEPPVKVEPGLRTWLDAGATVKGPLMRRSRRSPGRWIAPCRDIAGRRRELVVTPAEDGHIALIAPPGEVAVLDQLAAGQRRGALRDAASSVNDLRTAHLRRHEIALVGVGS